MAETTLDISSDCMDLIKSAADEAGELVAVLAKHIDTHGTEEVRLVARGILHRVSSLSFEIYSTASGRGKYVDDLRKALTFPGQEVTPAEER